MVAGHEDDLPVRPKRASDQAEDRLGDIHRPLLQQLDDVAYLRFASVYKGFEEAGDFQREAGLLTKTTEPKRK